MTSLAFRPRIVVVLGAGASYDVANAGVATLQQEWRPPLAANLFDANRYQTILKRYPGAQALAPRFATLAGINLESRLAEHARGTATQRRRYLDVPPYIRDVVAESVERYTDGPGTHVALALTLIEEVPHEVLFLTLNYDTYVESALSRIDSDNKFDRIDPSGGEDSYVQSRRQANLVKVHGFTDWFRAMPPGGSWQEALAQFEPERPWEALAVRRYGGPVSNVSIAGRWVYPVITAPLADKREDDLLCPTSHLEFAKTFIKSTYRYMFIGTSGMDDDLFPLMQRYMPPNGGEVMVVSGDQRAGQASLANLKARIPKIEGYSRASEAAVRTYYAGFREFVNSPEIDQFLQRGG